MLRPGRPTGFFTIFVTPGVSQRDHRRAVRFGPRAVSADRTQRELLEAAGFIDIEETDVTAELVSTARRWHRSSQHLETTLRASLGDQLFDERQDDRIALIAAAEEGLLSRALFVATAPP